MAAKRLTFPLVSRQHAAGVAFGGMRSRRRGIGSETASLRGYQPGDDVRRINWGASARLSALLGRDEFVVRDDYADQARVVVVAVDRSSSLGLYASGSPWLAKPQAIAACARLIADSARTEQCPLLCLDERGRTRAERHGPERVERFVHQLRFDAGSEGLARLLASIATLRVPRGSFVFCLSDFLGDVPDAAWRRASGRGFELVPVVIQEPVLERSFPMLRGVHVPLAEPGGGRTLLVRLSRADARAQRERNERRFAELEARLLALGLDWVDAASASIDELHAAFLRWGEHRLRRQRMAI